MNAAKKVLFATDYSDSAAPALTYAASLARDMGATLLVVHVSQLEEYPVGELFDEEPRPSDAELAELNAVKPYEPFIPCEHRLLHGDPAEEIVRLADEERVSAIVIGTHDRSRLLRLLGGSLAEKLLQTAHCPVITYRHSPQSAAGGGQSNAEGEATPAGGQETAPCCSPHGAAPPGESYLLRTVKEWTAHRPQLYRLFAEHGIDVFWDGDKTLADVCCEKGLDPQHVAEELATVVRPMYREAGADWYQATITELSNHIESTHHDFLRRELPRLGELVARTERAHRSEYPEIEAVKTIFERIRRHLLEHIETEGTVLFPALRRRETGETPDQEALADPINLMHRMKEDHDFIEAELSQIRRLTNGYAAPASASAAYRTMLGGLWELEANLHLNVHEEDDILFSKALLHQAAAGEVGQTFLTGSSEAERLARR